jgi:hypothetical protein
MPDSQPVAASPGECIIANDALSQETSIWRALGSQLRSKTVQFEQVRRELPHKFAARKSRKTAVCYTFSPKLLSLISEEKLTLCPDQRGAEWGIAGHEITRSDTGQHYAEGITFQEKTVFSTR